MTHVRITIDDNVEFDGSVTEWTQKTPDMFKDMIRPGATPQPWMTAIGMALSGAITTRRSANIDATTGTDEWTLKVKYR